MDVLSDPVPKKADAKQGAALRMVHELRREGLVDLLPREGRRLFCPLFIWKS